jgi:AcrR family transcriptional regulator
VDVKSRREEYAEATRTAIVEAAIDRFGADGFARTTIDAVADSARVTKGGVYHHFSDKAALFEAAFVSLEDQLLTAVVAAAAGAHTPWESAERGIDAYLDACREPRFRRIVLEDAPGALGWARWKEIDERYFLRSVRGALTLLARAGEIRLEDPDLTARLLLAAMGEAGLVLANLSDPAARDHVRASLLQLLHGLGPGTTTDPP